MLTALDRTLNALANALLFALFTVLFSFLFGGALTVFAGLPFELAFYICAAACALFAAYVAYLEAHE